MKGMGIARVQRFEVNQPVGGGVAEMLFGDGARVALGGAEIEKKILDVDPKLALRFP